ncbi:MAG: hypothetical protein J4431_01300 [Candidatus Aenigmarchaeota archaeon]|nr:hypothetical protein [Candidatus Aenigmarchaeota archaeon]
MGRKKGFDGKKISAIVSVLARNPDGVWLRQLSRDTGISATTAGTYVSGILKPLLEEANLGTGARPMLRVIRLKPYVFQKIAEGRSISEILKMLKILSSAESN